MKDLSLKELQDLKEKWYLESGPVRGEFIHACEELGDEAPLKDRFSLGIGGYKLYSYSPGLCIKKEGVILCHTASNLFVPGDWVKELRGLVANLRAEREERQRQELLKQLSPFGEV